MSQRTKEELRPLFIRFYFDEDIIIIAKRRSRDEITVAKLLDLLNSVTADEMQMQLRYV